MCFEALAGLRSHCQKVCSGQQLLYQAVTVSCSVAAAGKSLQSCPTLCNPMDGSPPGSSVPGILQARTLEWVAISFSSAWKLLSHAQLFVTPWTTAHQAPLSMRFSRQGYWSGVPFPSPGDLPHPGIKPRSAALQADSLPTELSSHSKTKLSNSDGMIKLLLLSC